MCCSFHILHLVHIAHVVAGNHLNNWRTGQCRQYCTRYHLNLIIETKGKDDLFTRVGESLLRGQRYDVCGNLFFVRVVVLESGRMRYEACGAKV